MRFEIDRGVLLEVLGTVVSCVPAKSAYPVLANIMLEVSGGVLTLSSTDLDIYVTKRVPLSGSVEDGRITAPGKKLLEMVRESAEGTVTIVGSDQRVKVAAGGVRAMFSVVDPAEYPEMATVPEGVKTEVPLSTLLAMYDTVGFAASKDESRPVMSALNWEVGKNETRLVATDGHRLALTTHKGKFAGRVKAIIPPKVFGLFPRGESVATVTSDPAKTGFVFQDMIVVVRAIEGPYPDYEKVIPKGSPGSATLDRDVLAAAVRRAGVLAHPIGRTIALNFAKSQLAIHAETPDLGSSDEELECRYSWEPLRIGFNATYVLDVLKRLPPGDVTVELSSSLAPALFRSSTARPDVDDTFLLMPIRLD